MSTLSKLSSFVKNNLLSAFILVVALAITGGVSLGARQVVVLEREENFKEIVTENYTFIESSLNQYSGTLFGLRGLFAASSFVDRKEFSTYVDSLEIKKHLPGIQAVEYVSRVTGSEKGSFVKNVREDSLLQDGGYPNFSIKPSGERDEYYVVNYVYPFEENIAAFGFDLFSNTERMIALENSVEENEIVATAPITLMEDGEQQPGFLVFLPIFENGTSDNTLAQRKKNLEGFVIFVFRSEDLINNLLSVFPESENINLVVSDITEKENEQLIYSSVVENVNFSSKFNAKQVIEFGGREWELTFSNALDTDIGSNKYAPLFTLLAGLVFSGLVFYITLNASRLRIKVNERTADLKKSAGRLDSIIKGTNLGTWEWNVQTGSTVFNNRWAEIIGYSLPELEPVSIKTWQNFTHPEDLKKSEDLFEKHFQKKTDFYVCESRMKHKDGHWVWVLVQGKVATWTDDGKPLVIYGTHQEITEEKEAVENLRVRAEELERVNELMVDRELVMVDLKKRIDELEKKNNG